jgi:hypothetical protein
MLTIGTRTEPKKSKLSGFKIHLMSGPMWYFSLNIRRSTQEIYSPQAWTPLLQSQREVNISFLYSLKSLSSAEGKDYIKSTCIIWIFYSLPTFFHTLFKKDQKNHINWPFLFSFNLYLYTFILIFIKFLNFFLLFFVFP